VWALLVVLVTLVEHRTHRLYSIAVRLYSDMAYKAQSGHRQIQSVLLASGMPDLPDMALTDRYLHMDLTL
jgi:hypothetical protein